jgi:hypothetical protein
MDTFFHSHNWQEKVSLRYRLNTLDRLESGTIAKALFRSSTALCLTKLNFELKFLIQVQSSKPIKTKMPLIT